MLILCLMSSFVSSFFAQMDESVWNENTLDEEEQKKKASRQEITTHVSIHTIHLDGLRELYRQFLRLPDGAVVEVWSHIFLY